MPVRAAVAQFAGARGYDESVQPVSQVATGQQYPLAGAREGDTVTVVRTKGTQDMRQHLAEMGFVEGAQVKVVSRVNGDMIVSVKGAKFGINRQLTSHIMCR